MGVTIRIHDLWFDINRNGARWLAVRWLAVLADAEALLDGRLLIPHWRLDKTAGIDLARLFEDLIRADAGLYMIVLN